ncbi:MAG: hypothetical protein Hyperionvirus17_19 [Hyperionvirus sp.]|uniref:Uncharacterized protein n=1 Tax=Hyperionvirus sp. TaxID=2487770 RepID=A0A3G5AFE7_9VIRU|nr:MAG: hypothetical protein Hyperionvirus17_19 [Hyperionvirus sp.]
MNYYFLQLVSFIHLLYLLFVIIVPFTENTLLLSIYVIVVPFMVFHWVVNDNTCALTVFEKVLRAQIYGTVPDSKECFAGRLIEPIYDVNKNYEAFSGGIYIATGVLWGIAVYKLVGKYRRGEIKSFWDVGKK